jgi:hypothetical protein
MTTKKVDEAVAARLETRRVERGRWAERLAHGFEVVVEGALAYRLRNVATGEVLGEYPDSRHLFLEAIRRVDTGTPAGALAMDVLTQRGRYVAQGGGTSLLDLAEAALDVPSRRRRRVAQS